MDGDLGRAKGGETDLFDGHGLKQENSKRLDIRFFSRILERAPTMVYVYDLERERDLFRNRAVHEVLGFDADGIEGRDGPPISELIHPDDFKRIAERQRELLAAKDGEIVSFEYRIRDSSGTWRWMISSESIFERGELGTPVSKLGMAEDITQRKLREESLLEAARVDPLTGLYNRRGFADVAAQHLSLAHRRKTPLTLLFFDLDEFKRINDEHGHAEGDLALKGAAGLLRGVFRSSDAIARVGGDEFVVLLVDAAEDCSIALVERFKAKVKQWNLLLDRKWKVSFSVGRAAFDPARPESLDELMDRADRAMYENKTASKRAAAAT